MRTETAKKIDDMHKRIAALIRAEKAHSDKAHPEDNRLWRNVRHASIEFMQYPPSYRERARDA